MQELIDDKTEQKLMVMLEQELEALRLLYPGQEVDRFMLIALNRRLTEREINKLLPPNVIFVGVQVYDSTKVKIMLRKMDA